MSVGQQTEWWVVASLTGTLLLAYDTCVLLLYQILQEQLEGRHCCQIT